MWVNNSERKIRGYENEVRKIKLVKNGERQVWGERCTGNNFAQERCTINKKQARTLNVENPCPPSLKALQTVAICRVQLLLDYNSDRWQMPLLKTTLRHGTPPSRPLGRVLTSLAWVSQSKNIPQEPPFAAKRQCTWGHIHHHFHTEVLLLSGSGTPRRRISLSF